MNQTERVSFMTQHEGLIHQALARLQLNPYQADYDDHLQNGRLTFLEAFDHFPGDLKTKSARETFKGYVSQRIYWQTIDNLRKRNSQPETVAELTDSQDQASEPLPTGKDYLLLDEAIEETWQELTEREKLFLYKRLIKDQSLQEIAEKTKVDLSTVYRWRRALRLKINASLES